jgi:hypothetical protein
MPIALRMVINNNQPDIPEFVLPSARELITDCWIVKFDGRLLFDEMLIRFNEMELKMIADVN